jgi:hypothetical protein
MQAYQSTPCLYCGATWNPPGAQTCAKCHNPLASVPAAYVGGLSGAAPAVAAAVADGGFYRSPLRTFLFTALASNIYLLWWTFQLLSFARRERFAKSASPWWLLFPIMNLVYISRAFKGIADGEKAALGQASLPLAAVSIGYLGVLILGRISANLYGAAGFVLDVSIALIMAGVLTLVQRSANRYQAAAHPQLGALPTGMAGRYTWGEIVALVVGSLLTLLLFTADLLPD